MTLRDTKQILTGITISILAIIIAAALTAACGDVDQPTFRYATNTTTTTLAATTTTLRAAPPTTVRAVTTSTTRVHAVTTTTEPDYHDLPDWYIWHKIGRCEQPGNGPDGINWTHDPNSSYPGGLGILRSSWNGYRREAGITITNGAHATPYQQILVARAIRKHFGLTGWTSVPDCTGPLP